MNDKLVRDVRFLKLYSFVLTAVLAVIVLSGFQQQRKPKFEQIDAERINIVEPNGKLDLAISNQHLFPPPILNGRTMERSGEPMPGMIFFNGNGDEQGGMGWNSGNKDGKYWAGGALMFDQYNQDQTVGLIYNDENGKREAGLRVWDHPEFPITQLFDRVEEAKKMKAGPEKEAAMKKIGEDWGSQRVFVGKQPDHSAVLLLSDTTGKTRIKIEVDPQGNPHLAFLDEKGKVTYALPPPH